VGGGKTKTAILSALCGGMGKACAGEGVALLLLDRCP